MTRRVSALFMMVLYLTGCATWRPVTLSPRQLIEEQRPGVIRVIQADGTRLDLRNPSIHSDSVTAVFRVRASSRVFRQDTIRISLVDVTAVEVRRLSVTRTILLIPVGGLAVMLAACLSNPDCFY
jgi:hypothetical protein